MLDCMTNTLVVTNKLIRYTEGSYKKISKITMSCCSQKLIYLRSFLSSWKIGPYFSF